MPARVLVTGATGLIGQWVVPELQRLGFAVRGHYARTPGSDAAVEWQRLDFTESLDVGPLVEGCDAVVHLAAAIRDVPSMERVNVEATRALAEAARAAGVRYFGHTSSSAVYGSPRHRDVDETTPAIDLRRPLAEQHYASPAGLAYARTKRLGEETVVTLQPSPRVDVYRPTSVVTPGQLQDLRNWSLARKIVRHHRRSQFVYAPDLAAAIGHLVVRGLAPSAAGPSVDVFNLCDEEATTYAEMLATAYAATGDRRYRSLGGIPEPVMLALFLAKHRKLRVRYPYSMLRFRNGKLRATGFALPTGMRQAFAQAVAAAAA